MMNQLRENKSRVGGGREEEEEEEEEGGGGARWRRRRAVVTWFCWWSSLHSENERDWTDIAVLHRLTVQRLLISRVHHNDYNPLYNTSM